LPFYCLKTILKVISIYWKDQVPFLIKNILNFILISFHGKKKMLFETDV